MDDDDDSSKTQAEKDKKAADEEKKAKESKQEIDNTFKSMLPSSSQIITMLKDSFGYNITDDGMLEVDVHSIIENNYNMSSLSFTLPTVNVSEIAA